MITENGDIREFKSDACNFTFNKKTGYTELWGKTKDDDPVYLPDGPMIADIEITTKCSGPGGILCPWCYKSNLSTGNNMSFDTFKTIFDKLPKTLTQIALGADADLSSNPDIWKIMHYCRNNDYNYVVPNITCADISDEVADKLATYCGAVAISRYSNKDLCYDSVKKLTDRGMSQVNLHLMLSSETYNSALDTLVDIIHDPRLKRLNAIVFLSLKNKGRGKNFTQLSREKFKLLVNCCLTCGIRFGFDSCSAHKFLESIKNHSKYDEFFKMAEPCESTLFSSYIDVNGFFHPCSFCEKTDGWEEGISVLDCNDFVSDIWNNKRTIEFREKLLNCNRNCPIYKI